MPNQHIEDTEPNWVNKHALLLLHEESLRRFGGHQQASLRDQGLLDSALSRAQNIFVYNPHCTIFELAAAYGFGIVKNHAFFDGNKRAGFLAIGLFLSINGYRLVADQTDAIETMLKLAAGELTEDELTAWIKNNVAPHFTE